jgi:Protein of unknown function (DUF2892)
MIKNIHDYERVGRVVGGLFLSSLAFWGPRKTWYLAFLVPIVTGLTGTCPFYSAMGVSTRKDEIDSQANDYFPVQSSSEAAAGHPLVGVS